MPKPYTLILALLFLSLVFPLPARAQTKSTQFHVQFSDISPRAHPNILLRISQSDPADEPFKKVVFTIPAGFDIAALPADSSLWVGVVNLCMSGLCNAYNVFNVADTAGHKAIWRVDGTEYPPLTVDVNVTLDGNVSSGHTLTFEWPESFLPSLATPLSLEFIIAGQTFNEPIILVTNPANPQETVWKAQIVSKGDKTQIVEAKPKTEIGSEITAPVSPQKTPTLTSTSTLTPGPSPSPDSTKLLVVSPKATASVNPTTPSPASSVFGFLAKATVVVVLIILAVKIFSLYRKRKRGLFRKK